ncbi:MAG TPA: nucleotidyltransferase, partial [Turneriella sp.]|nr:nucleotidyltransferase [Turneriella sp.]
MQKPTLLILAAGMGSRYGSLKQMDGLGPGGETIMDYSIYDAIRAGFGKVVFVIRKSFADDFKAVFSARRYQGKIAVEYVMQELDMIPSEFKLNPERTKPWGTNHAVMVASGVIKEPFAVINADDYYGRNAFEVLANFLTGVTGKQNDYCMVGYQLGKTLSELGAVSRGVCSADTNGYLTTVVERTHIERIEGTIKYKDENGNMVAVDDKAIVSMNMWGFTPDYFTHSGKMFADFLRDKGNDPKSEFFIPLVVNNLVASGTAKLKVLTTDSEWFGVTYQG